MVEPTYVAIAGSYARQIRSGELPPGVQLPSYADIGTRWKVSHATVRKALELLQSQGLVRSVRRRGMFVTDRPNLVRLSPERQTEDPEVTFANESAEEVDVQRDTEQIPASDGLAELFGLSPGDEVTHVVTRAAEAGHPISISDTYMPPGVRDSSAATVLEETVADRIPTPSHASWLQTTPGDLVKTVHQRFIGPDNQVIMVSDVSYAMDRYDALVFRMVLAPDGSD